MPIINPEFSSCLTSSNAFMYIVFNNIAVTAFNISKFVSDFERDFDTTNEKFHVLMNKTFKDSSNMVLRRSKPISYEEFLTIKQTLKNFSLSIWNNNAKVYITSTNIQSINKFYGFDVTKYFNNGICAESNKHNIFSSTFSTSCAVQTSFRQAARLDYTDLSLAITFTKGDIIETISHCYAYHLSRTNCPRVMVTTNFTFDNKRNTLSVITGTNATKVYSKTEFLPLRDGKFYICINDVQTSQLKLSYDWYKKLNAVEYYFSIGFVAVSTMCGILFFVAFAILKELRNRGGINVLVMAAFVLFADICYLLAVTIGVSSENSCKTLGIVLHWGLLSIQFWSTTLSFDLTFNLLRNQRRSSFKGKRLFFEILISIIPATVIVVVSVILNEKRIVKFDYGVKNICWIGSYYPRLAAYLIPALAAFLVSFICLFFLMYHLYRKENNRRKQLRDSGRNEVNLVGIATKLIVLLGIVEIVGAIQIVKAHRLNENELIFNATFSLLYSLIRSLRGCLIFLLYLGNKKTLKIFRARFDLNRATAGPSTEDFRLSK